jgi:hypothetical protein
LDDGGEMFRIKPKTRAFRIFTWIAGGILVLICLVIAFSYAASDPLRRYIENNINSHLDAYTVTIEKLRLRPPGFSLHLYDLRIIQKAKPDPPVAHIPHLAAGVHWRELLRARLVADFTIDRPSIHFDIRNVKEEQRNEVPIKREGWQEAAESIYPLKINLFTVREADLTYIDRDSYKPLHLSRLNFEAGNIRNIRSPEHVYPSSIHLDGVVFDIGRISLDGNANFLAEPHVTLKAGFALEKMDLSYFKPITDRYNLAVTGGFLSTIGNFEYAVREKIYQLDELFIDGAKFDYVHLPQTAGREKQTAKKAAESAKELSNEPTVTTEIERLKISNSEFGFVNKAAETKYRLFISDTEIDVENFSNQFLKGPAGFKLTGKFMGSGATRVTGTFRPEKSGADFDLAVAIEQTRMKSMSDLFRAYGNFAIESGLFSFYSELAVKEKTINGYVKPMFKDMEVTDKRTKDEKSLFHKLYVGIIEAISELLENPQDKVATKADISGPIEDPRASTWQIIARLVQNAFFKSILPGFSDSIPASEK